MGSSVKKKYYTAKYDKILKAIFVSDDYEL